MSKSSWFVGVRTSAISYLDEGVDRVLDALQESTDANVIFVVPHGYNPELIDRPTYHPGHGNHGPHGHTGGSFFATHPEYYDGIQLGNSRASGSVFGDFDVLGTVIPAAHARGLSVYGNILEGAVTGGRETTVPGFPRVLEVDVHGRRGALGCINNETYRSWQLALMEDIYKSYPLDGFMWGVERWGPLHQALMGEAPACFCSACQSEAARGGLDPRRVLTGYRALYDAMQHWRSGGHSQESSPAIDLLQLIFTYPELISWEQLWTERYLSLHRELYGAAKWLAPERPFGLALWHYYFINPLLRAEWPLRQWAEGMDFISPILYRWPEGARLASFLDSLTAGPATGLTPEALFGGLSTLLGLQVGSVADFATNALPADYVGQGVGIVRNLVGPTMPIYPGLGIDVVQEGIPREMEPTDVEEDIQAAFDAGADGIVISRNYAEMRTPNVEAVRRTLNRLLPPNPRSVS